MRSGQGSEDSMALLDKAGMQDLFALAVRLYIHQMYEQSAKIMQFLLRHDPGKPHFHRALGKALHAQGRYDQAVLSYARAIKLGMPDADVHFYMGQCLIFLRRYDLAREAIDRCILLARTPAPGSGRLLERAKSLHEHLSNRTRRSVNASTHAKETT